MQAVLLVRTIETVIKTVTPLVDGDTAAITTGELSVEYTGGQGQGHVLGLRTVRHERS